MVGFDQAGRRMTYALTFRPYPGLTVWCRKPGYAALEDLTDAVIHLGEDFAGDRIAGDDRVRWWGALFRALRRSVVDWNLTDHGRSVPVADLLDQDPDFLLALARTWYAVVVLRDEAAATAPEVDDTADPEEDDVEDLEHQLADLPVRIVELPDDVPAADAAVA